MIVIGGYVFARAGIRRGIEPDSMAPGNLRWIGEPFLRHIS